MEYYTPDIEDLFVGYECERQFKDKWIKDIIEEAQLTSSDNPFQKIIIDISTGKLRTPYLTKEQIEKEGWIYDQDEDGLNFVKGPWDLAFYTLKSIIKIDTDDRNSYGYYGPCKSINEFRKICKLLGI